MEREETIEELWDAALRKRGFVDPRDGITPSHSRLAEAAGVGITTVSNMRYGLARTSPATIAKVAAALQIPVTELSRWVGQARSLPAPYTPPPEADLLDERERRAVSEVIRLLAAHRTPDPAQG